MNDVIIAIIPAPGHEALTADGPMGERPALLLRDLGEWLTTDRAAHAPHLYNDEDVALVLHAPGDPKLGMLRAMDAAFGADAEAAVVRWDGEHEAFALAHLLMQRGIAAEVIVLPADKAKE